MRRLSILAAAWAAAIWMLLPLDVATESGADEAPAGFDNLTNGLVSQDVHDGDRDVFTEQELIADGLGPVYNAQSCGECHQNPVTGGISQITEQRAGRLVNGAFVSHPGDSLIHSRAIDARIQEHVLSGHPVRTFRTSLNTLGDGFVEAIANDTLRAIANEQPGRSFGFIRGQVVMVPIAEAPGQTRIGRFGHKTSMRASCRFRPTRI